MFVVVIPFQLLYLCNIVDIDLFER